MKQQSIGNKFHAYRCLANFCQRSSFDEGTVTAYDVVLTQLSDFWENMAENTYLIWVQTKDLEWAFRVFHSLNDTGVPLKDIDKLKAHMLNNWSSHGGAQLNHAKTWNDCIKMVEEEDAFDQVVRYIAIGAGMDLRDNLLVFMVNHQTDAAWLSFVAASLRQQHDAKVHASKPSGCSKGLGVLASFVFKDYPDINSVFAGCRRSSTQRKYQAWTERCMGTEQQQASI